MSTLDDVRRILARINGRGYKAYKEMEGAYDAGSFWVFVDHVQGDPFAAPSKIRVRVSHEIAGIPSVLWKNTVRRVALRDFLPRALHRCIRKMTKGQRGIGKSGRWFIDVGGQEVIERTAMIVTDQWIEARMEVGLPASGRTILGKYAEVMFCQELPQVVKQGLMWSQLPQQACEQMVETVENYHAIRQQLGDKGLVGFVADESILPRASGNSDRPLIGETVVPFHSPESLRVSFELPNPVSQRGASSNLITGMGVPQGITLIVGGGYHGKSTLLQALQRGVYPHLPGDGREYIVTSPDAVKIRAEDGRSVRQVDISGFIDNLPQGQATHAFSTGNASGSTSQAATIVEAMEVGSQVLLMDEDTCATNFMIRDARMQALVAKECEPITPFLDRVRELSAHHGVSTILVMGGCGDYFDVANTVILVRHYRPEDVTDQAKKIAVVQKTGRCQDVKKPLPSGHPRLPLAASLDPSRGHREVNITIRAVDEIVFGTEIIELRGVEQLVEVSQTRAVGCALLLAARQFADGKTSVKDMVEAVEALLNQEGLDRLDPFYHPPRHPGNFARPRPYEIAAALNRLRSVQMR